VPGPKFKVSNYWTSNADADSKKWGAETITHAFLWPKFSDYLRPGDVVVTETGTSNFGIMETAFPKNATSVNQYLWGSIGYATGAAQGAAMAVADLKTLGGELSKTLGRSILWTGDGSLQLTAQAVATMLRNNVDLILFVINNDGYTIERFIHGMDAGYNDIQPWKYTDLPAVFGAKEGQSKSFQVRTKKELIELWGSEALLKAKGLVLVEVFMPKEDAPEFLISTSKAAAKGLGGGA